MTDKSKSVIETVRVEKLACIECQKVLDVFHLPSFSEIKCPECGTRQTVPAKFGSFLLLSRLGAGGMGVIYHAVDRELGRHVALKVMKKSLGENPEFVRSFKREAQAAAALNHRNVVQIYSFGQVEGQPYIAMELVDGGRLDDMIASGVPFRETRALELHLEVTEGLKAASEVGLVHGDIKPANILFGQNGEAKVVDFGLASFIGQQQQGGQVWGTPYYIAPEKARGKRVDFRSDIYSLGATLFHTLAGQPPFDGPTPVDVVLARLSQQAPSLLEFQEDLHPQTVAMVARMLETEPTMRYPSYEALLVDMRDALEASKKPLKKPGSKPTILAPLMDYQVRIHWKKVGIAGIIFMLLLFLSGGGVWFYQHQVRLAAEAKEKKTYAEAKERGSVTWPRIEALSQTIMKNADAVLPLAEKADQLAQSVPESEPAMIELRGAVEQVIERVNEVEDIRVLALFADQALETSTDSQTAILQADRLESCFQSLIEAYNIVEASKPIAEKALADAIAISARINATAARARQAAAEATAKQKAEEAARVRAQKLAQEAERIRPLIAQRELDLVDEARASNAPFIVQRKFDEAAQSISRIQSDLTMEESKAYYRAVVDGYHAMNKLKLFLVRAIRNSPYLSGWAIGETTRDIVYADVDQGVTIALGSAGQLVMSWDQVNVYQFLKIARYYIDTMHLSDQKQAEILLSVALFCYENGAFKTAENCAAAACRLNPTLKEELNRFMPGLVSE